MHNEAVFYIIFLIFVGAAIFSTLVLYTKQSLLVAYILLGCTLGPWGLKLISDISIVQQIGEIGIVFLLFLLGLNLQPQNLFYMLRKITGLTIISSLLFALIAFIVGRFFHLSNTESVILGAAMMFSSTIIGLKLLPTTILHHQHTGEVMISVLLMQDVIAIIVLIFLNGAKQVNGLSWLNIISIVISLPTLGIIGFIAERYILVKLLARFDRTQEYVFLLCIGWCLGMSYFAQQLGLSEEIGAFIAGVILASSPISLYIADSLKPLRDFFLVMFFVSIGATFNFGFFNLVIIPAFILALLMLILKPLLFSWLLRFAGEKPSIAKETGIRLGQASEFSLFVASIALSSRLISDVTSNLIQATTILTFIISSYLVVLKYPTPIALSDKMRKD